MNEAGFLDAENNKKNNICIKRAEDSIRGCEDDVHLNNKKNE